LRVQEEQKLKKEATKMKKEGRAVMNAMSVAFAKFEVEVTIHKSDNPDCPLLEHAAELVNEGKRIKAAANNCVAFGGPCQVKMPEVSVWLKKVGCSTKALQAMNKSPEA